MTLKEQLGKELAAMEEKKQSFWQSYWQADGACQSISGVLRMIEQAEAATANGKPNDEP